MPYRFEISFWFQFGFMCLIVGAVSVLAMVVLSIESDSPDARNSADLSAETQVCGLPSKKDLAEKLIATLVGTEKSVGFSAPATLTAKVALFLLDALFLTLVGNLMSALVCSTGPDGTYSVCFELTARGQPLLLSSVLLCSASCRRVLSDRSA